VLVEARAAPAKPCANRVHVFSARNCVMRCRCVIGACTKPGARPVVRACAAFSEYASRAAVRDCRLVRAVAERRKRGTPAWRNSRKTACSVEVRYGARRQMEEMAGKSACARCSASEVVCAQSRHSELRALLERARPMSRQLSSCVRAARRNVFFPSCL